MSSDSPDDFQNDLGHKGPYTFTNEHGAKPSLTTVAIIDIPDTPQRLVPKEKKQCISCHSYYYPLSDMDGCPNSWCKTRESGSSSFVGVIKTPSRVSLVQPSTQPPIDLDSTSSILQQTLSLPTAKPPGLNIPTIVPRTNVVLKKPELKKVESSKGFEFPSALPSALAGAHPGAPPKAVPSAPPKEPPKASGGIVSSLGSSVVPPSTLHSLHQHTEPSPTNPKLSIATPSLSIGTPLPQSPPSVAFRCCSTTCSGHPTIHHHESKSGEPGKPGKDGKDGDPGKPGKDGDPGKDGRDAISHGVVAIDAVYGNDETGCVGHTYLPFKSTKNVQLSNGLILQFANGTYDGVMDVNKNITMRGNRYTTTIRNVNIGGASKLIIDRVAIENLVCSGMNDCTVICDDTVIGVLTIKRHTKIIANNVTFAGGIHIDSGCHLELDARNCKFYQCAHVSGDGTLIINFDRCNIFHFSLESHSDSNVKLTAWDMAVPYRLKKSIIMLEEENEYVSPTILKALNVEPSPPVVTPRTVNLSPPSPKEVSVNVNCCEGRVQNKAEYAKLPEGYDEYHFKDHGKSHVTWKYHLPKEVPQGKIIVFSNDCTHDIYLGFVSSTGSNLQFQTLMLKVGTKVSLSFKDMKWVKRG